MAAVGGGGAGQAQRRIAVVGAGALGLTVAYRLAQAGESVRLIEREPELGGLAAGFRIGNAFLEKFYHHLFKSDRDAVALIEELGLGSQLEWHRPNTSTLVGGQIRQLDSPLTLLRFQPLPLKDRVRLGAVLAYLKLERDHRRFEGQTAANWLPRMMGERAYRVLWEPLLKAKFGDRYRDIAMTWFWSRIFCRTTELGYLRGGFQFLYERLGSRITELGGTLDLNLAVRRITPRSGGGFIVETDRDTAPYDVVVATVPTRLLFRLVEGLPDDYRARYDWGDAFGAHCVILELDRSLVPVYWLNINDPGYPFLSLVEHTNLIPPGDYNGNRLVYLGNYLPMDDPLFSREPDAIVRDFLPSLQRINPRFSPEWVRASHVFKAPYAQPIVTVDYPQHIPPFDTPLPGLFLGSMFQVYPQDRGQNYSIRLGQQLAAHVLSR